MNKLFTDLKYAILYTFFNLIHIWADTINEVSLIWVMWSYVKKETVMQKATQALLKEEQKKDIDSFIHNMQRQAKITRARPKKDNEK